LALKGRLVGGPILAEPAVRPGITPRPRLTSKSNIAIAEPTAPQGVFADGKDNDARMPAARAQVKLKRATPASLRADGVISYKPARLHETRLLAASAGDI
jgi:hypothetical protein